MKDVYNQDKQALEDCSQLIEENIEQQWKAKKEKAELQKLLSETCDKINQLLDEAKLVNNFQTDIERNGGYFYKNKMSRMTKQMVNNLDIELELHFETDIKPLVQEKIQRRDQAIRSLDEEKTLLSHEFTTAEFEMMTINDTVLQQRKKSASNFDTEYKSKESKKLLE